MKSEAKPRRLVRMGNSIGITLPPEFIQRNGLKAGDTIGLSFNSIIVIVVPRLPEDRPEAKDQE